MPRVRMKLPSELEEGEFFELEQPHSPIIIQFLFEYGKLEITLFYPDMPAGEVFNLYHETPATADELSRSLLLNGARYLH